MCDEFTRAFEEQLKMFEQVRCYLGRFLDIADSAKKTHISENRKKRDVLDDIAKKMNELKESLNPVSEIALDGPGKNALKRFREKMTEAGSLLFRENGEDDGLALVSASDNFICPITKREFQDPVKSTQCGHSYSREGVNMLFSGKTKIKCPVCKKEMEKKDIEEDVEMITKMKRKRKRGLENELDDNDDNLFTQID
eukprot:comp19009_c0_seq2/m.35074 comp19009_c0_seq2/g.35074  ORF comp19009_c0_seq2/g.35074 comp19009_c0_seq2/m.35074 type:complete len:197 (-) comp19009_c0_seq2:10-600(-)